MTNYRRGVRCSRFSQKRLYNTKAEAERGAHRLRQARNKPAEVYGCDNHWHVGTLGRIESYRFIRRGGELRLIET